MKFTEGEIVRVALTKEIVQIVRLCTMRRYEIVDKDAKYRMVEEVEIQKLN